MNENPDGSPHFYTRSTRHALLVACAPHRRVASTRACKWVSAACPVVDCRRLRVVSHALASFRNPPAFNTDAPRTSSCALRRKATASSRIQHTIQQHRRIIQGSITTAAPATASIRIRVYDGVCVSVCCCCCSHRACATDNTRIPRATSSSRTVRDALAAAASECFCVFC